MAGNTKIKTDEKEMTFTRSSGNVFADLGLDNPEELLCKSYFVSLLNTVIKKRKLTQVRAAEITFDMPV
jgi:predicted XRE-type DNA-binding protein